jgi:putative transposase
VFQFIATEQGRYPVRLMCRVLAVSASGFYAAHRRAPSVRAQQDVALRQRRRVEAAAAHHTDGSPRLHRCLQAAGQAVGRNRVIRLMRVEGLQVRRRRRFRRTTQSGPAQPIAPNHLARAFHVTHPNCVWVADLTYLDTAEGWLYLAVLVDLYARRVVGWATRPTLATDLPLAALQMALAQRRPPRGGLHHSDRGLQYASATYRALLQHHGWAASMSGRGNCYDHAVAESFFGSLKRDLDVDQWPSRAAAHAAVRDYIERFYNPVRLHSTLDYQSPIQFEAHA